MTAILDCLREFEMALGYNPEVALSVPGEPTSAYEASSTAPTEQQLKSAAEAPIVQKLIKEARRNLQVLGRFYALELLSTLQDMTGARNSLGKEMTWERFQRLSWLSEHHLAPPFKIEGRTDQKTHDLEKVMIASRIACLQQASLRIGMCALALLFYALATVIIGWITCSQAWSVAREAGWIF